MKFQYHTNSLQAHRGTGVTGYKAAVDCFSEGEINAERLDVDNVSL
jgi:hypothetical protein